MEDIFKPACTFILMIISGMIGSFKTLLTTLMQFPIEDLNNSTLSATVTSAAVSLTSLFFAMEMFSQMAQFRVERIEDAIRIAMKFVVAKVIIENSDVIIKGIYAMLNSISIDSIGTALDALETQLADPWGGNIENLGGFFGIGYFILSITLLFVAVAVFILMGFIVIQVVSVLFEISIHQIIGPIALSTLCNDTARSAGISFIKSYTAVCLQFTVIAAIFTAFSAIQPKLTTFQVEGVSVSTAGIYGGFFNYMMPLICLIVLCVSISKANDMTKRMFGA